MFKRLALMSLPVAMLGAAAAPAMAQGRYDDYRYERSDRYDNRYARPSYDRYETRRYDGRRYANGARCDNGTGGTIIGAVAGGLVGREVAGRRDRTLGTVLGAAGGALVGRAIDRRNDPCRPRNAARYGYRY